MTKIEIIQTDITTLALDAPSTAQQARSLCRNVPPWADAPPEKPR